MPPPPPKKSLSDQPELHLSVDQSQRDEVLASSLAVVEQDAVHLRGPEGHGDPDRVVRLHCRKRQVGLAPEGWNEVFHHCGGGGRQ